MKKWLLLISVFVLSLGLAACGNKEDKPTPATEKDKANDGEVIEDKNPENATGEELLYATVSLIDREGNPIGSAELTEEDEGVGVKLSATGLPEGTHGFHFHEVGKCEVPDFESAGGHFNPTGVEHGLEHDEGPHAGDLPNLEVDADGMVEGEFIAEHLTLESGQENSLMHEGGTALVIHAEADDGKTQPSGDSGERIVCGVVE